MNINKLFLKRPFLLNKDTSMKVLEFEILERKYQISCPDKEEEILKACVTLVDSRMKALKTQGKLHSTEKIAIMVALTLAKDFLKVGGANGDESSEKIVELTNTIEKALAPQDNLFLKTTLFSNHREC